VGNLIDPYNRDNSYTYDFTGYETTTTSPNDLYSTNYLTTIVNSYEKCLIALSWNRIYTGNTFNALQVVRTTYTIKTHVDFIHNTATEFYSTGSFAYKETGTRDTVRNKLWSPCKVNNRYYWHPYEKLYFFFDEDKLNQYLIITCFPYNSQPQTACDVDYNVGGSTAFYKTIITDMNPGTVYRMQEFVTFGMTHDGSVKSAYAAVVVKISNGQYQSRIYRLVFSGSSCETKSVSLEATPIYQSETSATIHQITSLAAIHNVGIGFVLEGSKGIFIVPIASDGSHLAVINIENDASWKLIQMGIDSGDPPPVFGLSSAKKSAFYRVTNIATLAYENSTLNFYDYPADVGRFHVMVVHPGKCGESSAIDSRDHDVTSVHYVTLENMIVDMCIEEVREEKCGNGILDQEEECDDGNNRVVGAVLAQRGGDGCDENCRKEIGWRCYNNPYNTRTLCEHNECGDSFINREDPENEECDDGNLLDDDGCTSECKKMKGYFCPLPGYACIKVCTNKELDYYPGPPHNLEIYKEACDDGNEVSGDGKLPLKH
jgi:cysteine-rich repeat protein